MGEGTVRTIWIRDDFEQAASRLTGKFAAPVHAGQVIADDARLIAPDGTITAVLLTKVIPANLHRRAYELLRHVNGNVGNRIAAVGSVSLPKSVRNGIASPRSGVNEIVLKGSSARQGILGWDRPGHLTTLTQQRPEMLEGNRELIELVDQLFAQHLPQLYAQQRTIPWKLWGTSFSTAYVAKNFQTAYHRDGNLRGAMTAIMPLGKFTGGALLFPRWRTGIAYQPGYLLLCDAEQLHGNLPFTGDRVALVLYCGRFAGNTRGFHARRKSNQT